MSKVIIDGKEVEATVSIQTQAVVEPDKPPVVPTTPPALGTRVIDVTWAHGIRQVNPQPIRPGEVLAYKFRRDQIVWKDPTRLEGEVVLSEAPLVKMALSSTPGTFYETIGPGVPQMSGSNNLTMNYVTNQYFNVPGAIQYGYRILPDGDFVYLNVMLQPDQPNWQITMYY